MKKMLKKQFNIINMIMTEQNKKSAIGYFKWAEKSTWLSLKNQYKSGEITKEQLNSRLSIMAECKYRYRNDSSYKYEVDKLFEQDRDDEESRELQRIYDQENIGFDELLKSVK